MLNQIIKDSLGTLQIHSILEPPGLSRTDFKRPDQLSLTPWIRGSSLIWDATVVVSLAPSRLQDGDLYAGKAAAENLKAKISEPLVRDGYYFRQLPLRHRETAAVTPLNLFVILVDALLMPPMKLVRATSF